jgi:hypothetical protein
MASDLVRRTTDLRAQTLSPEVPEEHRALIGQYLADAAEDFVPRMRGLIEPEGEFLAPISQIRMTAVQNRIVQHQDIPQMKVLVAALPRGTSFARAFVVLPGAGLAPDGRVFLESMQARLAGNMSAALAGCQRFEGEFSKSPLRATALRLMADTYANAGRYSEAMAIAGRATCQCPGAPQPVMNAAAYLVEFGPRGFDFRAPTIDHIELRAPAIEHVFKGTPGELLKGMPGVDHMFKGIIQISGSSGARVWIMKSEAVPPTRLTELLSDEPESRPVRNPK